MHVIDWALVLVLTAFAALVAVACAVQVAWAARAATGRLRHRHAVHR